MRSIVTTLLCALTACWAMAQTVYISNSRDMDFDRFENLNGKCGLLLLSKVPNLKVRVTNASDSVSIKAGDVNAAGLREYYVTLYADDTRQPKVSVSERADVFTTDFVAEKLKPDFYVAYRIDKTAQQIIIDNQTKPNDAVLNAAQAMVELTTTLGGLQAQCSPKLNAQITTAKSSVDSEVNITSILIPVAPIVNARTRLAALQAESKELNDKISADKATIEEMNRSDQVEADLAEAAQLMRELGRLEIYTEESNHLVLDMSGLSPRAKLCYAVLALNRTKEVHKTQYGDYVSQAGALFAERKYDEALTAYQLALKCSDIEETMKPVIRENISDCDTCLAYVRRANFCIMRIKQLREQDNATQQEVARYASMAHNFFEKVNELNPHDYYTRWIAKLNQMLSDMPLKILFTTVEWLTLSEGNALPDVEIWAYTGKGSPKPGQLTSIKAFSRALKAQANDYHQVGVTGADGKVEIELARTQLPAGFVFCPTGDSKVKPTYITFDSLMREATGTYLEKQFRLKMYKRTNKYF